MKACINGRPVPKNKTNFFVSKVLAEKILHIKNIIEPNKFFRFFWAGLPAFFIAISLNYLFVEYLDIHKLLSYAFVLLVQVSINFFAAIYFVFKRNRYKSIKKQYVQFVVGIFFIRLCDWVLYGLMVQKLNFYYLFIQLLNVLLFSIIKYIYAKKIIEEPV